MDELTLFHELTLFRDFRADTPGPSADETEAARARLLDAIMASQGSAVRRPASSQRRRAWLRRLTRTRFWAPVAAAVAVIAVAITMVLLAVPASTTSKPKPSVHPRHHTSHRTHGTSKPAGRHGPASGAGGRAGASAAGSAAPGAAGSAAPGAAGAPGPAGSATPTATALTVSTGRLSPGQTVTLTATVSSQADGDLSGGTVSFYMNPGQNDVYAGSSDPLCTHAQLSGDVATCSYTPQTAQTDLLFAVYSGYQQFKESESGSAAVTVVASTTSTLAISSAQVSPGQTVTLTATVTDQSGDDLSGGTVSFYVDVGQDGVYSGAAEPVCTDVALTYSPATHDNVATCSYTPESAQTDQLSVEYSGYGEYAESGSAADLTVT